MKYFRQILLSFLGIFLILSCSKNKTDPDQIVLKGKVTGIDKAGQEIYIRYSKVYEDRLVPVDSLLISGENSFSFPIKNEGIYKISILPSLNESDNQSVYVAADKGDEISLSLKFADRSHFKTEFKGKQAEIYRKVNRFLNELVEKDIKELYAFIALPPEDQKLKSPEIRQHFLKMKRNSLKNMRKESDPVLKKILCFTYLNYVYFLGTMDYYEDRKHSDEEYLKAGQIFKVISPVSYLWSFNSQLPLMVLSDYRFPFTLQGYGTSLKHNAILLDSLIKGHPDQNVSGYTDIFSLYTFALDRDTIAVQKYTEMYLKRDPKNYDQEVQQIFKSTFDPGRAIKTGNQLPEFSVPSFDDPEVIFTNATFKNKVYLIDFWATWCKPCMKEIPEHHSVYKTFAKKYNFDILSISFDRSPEIVEKFRSEKWPMPWKQAILAKGKQSAMAKRMEAYFLPQMILVDGRTNTIIAELIHLKEGRLSEVLEDYFEKDSTVR